jgi:signal peptide peptidase SppA
MNNPLLARFASQPVLVTPHMDDWFQACVMGAVAHERFGELSAATASNDDGFWFAADDWRAAYRPYVVKDGILQIPVKGVLLHDFPWSLGSWATGYAYIWRAFERGLADAGVRGIALMCDTPGGMVAGCFELVDKMFAARGAKPVRAFAHESAYSAGYAIASVADRIAVSRTGGVGSIGVVTMHADWSKALDQAGLKITFIYAGKHKVDGNPTAALPDDVKARIQSRIDDIYGVFAATVARNRSLSEKAVRDTEALTFTGPEAVSNGLADAIGSLDDAVAAFAADLSSPTGDDDMSNKDTTATDQAALETARTEAHAAGVKEGLATGATAERTRIQAILGHENAKDRGEMASHLAFASDMGAEAAVALLGKAPKQAAAQPAKGRLDAALRGTDPAVGAHADDGGEAQAPYERGVALAARFGTKKKAAA